MMYQVVASRRLRAVNEFLGSEAAPEFDIISLHPYAWFSYPNSFPSPETWMKNLMDSTKLLISRYGLDMSIWFSEIGAPHHGNCDTCFCGYPSSGTPVNGTTLRYGVVYMIKCHALGLSYGAEKIFWYNYRDRGDSRDYSEDHFGTKDYWRYPKPAYAAYLNLFAHIKDKAPAGVAELSGNVWTAGFTGTDEDCIIAWIYPAAEADVDVNALVSAGTVTGVKNAAGAPQAFNGSTVRLTGDPVFITVDRSTGIEDAPPGETVTVECRPNPFTAVTSIRISSELRVSSDEFRVIIFDLQGRKLATRNSQLATSFTWNASGLPAGVYILKVSLGNRTVSKRVMLLP
jgi:hypothetical protein